MTDFIDHFEKKLLLEWAKGDLGTRLLLGGVGVLFNALADQQTRAVCAGLIASPHSPDDILPIVGRERGGLSRIPGESVDGYRSRLIHAAEAWEYAGTDKAIQDQLILAGFTGSTVVYYADRRGPHDEQAPYYSHFWVRIPLAVLQARPGWSTSPRWGVNMTWGCFWWGYGSLSNDDARLFWSIVNKFKPADHICRGIEMQT